MKMLYFTFDGRWESSQHARNISICFHYRSAVWGGRMGKSFSSIAIRNQVENTTRCGCWANLHRTPWKFSGRCNNFDVLLTSARKTNCTCWWCAGNLSNAPCWLPSRAERENFTQRRAAVRLKAINCAAFGSPTKLSPPEGKWSDGSPIDSQWKQPHTFPLHPQLI